MSISTDAFFVKGQFGSLDEALTKDRNADARAGQPRGRGLGES